MQPAAAAHLDVHARRKRVDDGDADAVQAGRYLVARVAKFSASVQHRQHGLQCGSTSLRVHVARNAAAIVRDFHGAVGAEPHVDTCRVAGQRLVDGVVHGLVDHVMQAGPVIGVADIHARALAHRVEPLEHLDGVRAVFGARLLRLGLVGHACPVP